VKASFRSHKDGNSATFIKETNMNNTDTQTKGSAPTHIAYQVREGKDGKKYWQRIGAAWAHKDGKGFSGQMDVLPPDGSFTLRVATKKEKQ
jgi:hypothetical protein